MIEISKNSSFLPGTDSELRPGDFPLGSLESRAAARAKLDTGTQRSDRHNRLEIVSYIPRSRQDNSKPHATPWTETLDGGVMRILFVPSGMTDAEAEPSLATNTPGEPRSPARLGNRWGLYVAM